jgi:hypothetical protein
MVWTGSSGKLEGAPVRRADVAIWETFAALWDAEWSRTGPQWTGRL